MSPVITEKSSTAVTRGVRITVQPLYVPEKSNPPKGHYFFAYQITITNEGTDPAQLRTRHWIITDGNGRIHEVKGDGVVGQQPRLECGESHEYTSFCPLETPRGSMHGTFQMFRDDDSSFDAEVPAFALVAAVPDADKLLN